VKILGSILRWVLVLIFGLISVSLLAGGNWGRALLALTAILVLLAPVRRWFGARTGKRVPRFAYGGVVVHLRQQ
jgi:hypothetical protein